MYSYICSPTPTHARATSLLFLLLMIISDVEWQKTFFLLSFVHIVKRSMAIKINSREKDLKNMKNF